MRTPLLLSTLLSVALAAAAEPGGPALFQPGVVSGPLNDYNLSMREEAGRMVFARSQAHFAGAHVYVSERRHGRWTAPAPIAFSDARWRDSDPWLTPDGRTLYFISDRPTPARPDKTDFDLWRAQWRDGAWSAPEHLGDALNSQGEEFGPELHDGVLYFSSSRAGGPGGLDIYAAPAAGDGFAAAAPMPAPINSAGIESDFTLGRDGTLAVFWRVVDKRALLHASRRTGTGWSTPTPLPAAINAGPMQFTPSLSGHRLTYAGTATRPGQEPGMADVYSVDLPAALFQP